MKAIYAFQCFILPCAAAPLFIPAEQTTQFDPCIALGTGPQFSTYNATNACLNYFPFLPDIRTKILSNVRKTLLQLYVFRDIQRNYTDGAIIGSIDLSKSLDQIENKEYIKDREFHNDLSNLLISLNDAHTKYFSNCYHTWRYFQPWVIITRLEHGTGIQKVYIQNLVFQKGTKMYDMFKEQIKRELDTFIGWEVVSLGGKPVFEYLKEFSEHLGQTKDPNTRLNIAFGRMDFYLGDWKSFYGLFASRKRNPNSESVSYELKKPDTGEIVNLTASFIVRKPFNFKNANDFWTNRCLANDTNTDNQTYNELAIQKNSGVNDNDSDNYFNDEVQEVEFVAEDHFDPKPIEILSKRSDEFDINKPLSSNKYHGIYDLNGSTGVLKISGFSSDIGCAPALEEYDRNLQVLKDRGITKLIIDFRNNGGGIICLGYGLIALLFPQEKNFEHFADFISSPLLNSLIDNAEFKNSTRSLFHFQRTWKDSSNPEKFKNKEWLKNGVMKTRGAAQLNCTREFSMSSNKNIRDLFTEEPNTMVQRWSPENISILSNGYCGSTCALVARSLQETMGVRQFVVGGNFTEKMAFSDFSGGQLYSYKRILEDIEALQIDKCLDKSKIPEKMPTKAEFTFTIREAYSKIRKSDPLEYVYAPASDRIAFTESNVYHPAGLWNDVSDAMKKSSKMNKKPAKVRVKDENFLKINNVPLKDTVEKFEAKLTKKIQDVFKQKINI